MYQHHFCIEVERLLNKEIATNELKLLNIADFIESNPFAYIGLVLGFRYKDRDLKLAYEKLKKFTDKYQEKYFKSVGKEIKNFDKMIKDLQKLLD